ncbi:recombinase family protein [Streptomyces qinglanensis]|uniref:recombinase family protein n=1 Tax=Streptomyces qinglanensis TaxID=943816 RepID=UPI003D7332A2
MTVVETEMVRIPGDQQRGEHMTAFAFAGRCSTEDLQDPETSRQWQLRRARALIEPNGGEIVAEFFDSGHSRALPWKRRPRGDALLKALGDPERGFEAVVIGEPQRTFYGNQFGNTFPLFVHHGVPLWVPEIGGAIDPENEAHDLVMSVFGGMSKGERNRIKVRTRTAMASQLSVEGRYQGGRPPYGYRLVDSGPHPHPGKAAEGKRLQRLEPDPATAHVVARIFAEYLRGKGLYAIAEGLTRDGISCPSAHDRVRNRHRRGYAWSKGAIGAILDNPRYTGHEVWNRQRRRDVLVDVEDVTLGYRSKLEWNDPSDWVWSTEVVHTPLVEPAIFTAVQTKRRARRSTGGVERKPRQRNRTYALGGLMRHALCGRKMQGNHNNGAPYYRCRYTAEYAKSAQLDHPLTVYVRESVVVPKLDGWIARHFSPDRLPDTLRKLHAAQQKQQASPDLAEARQKLADCERRLAGYRAALDAGSDPALVGQWINETQQDKSAVEQRLRSAQRRRPQDIASEAELETMIRTLGDMKDRLLAADPAEKRPIYEAFGLALTYDERRQAVTVESRPAAACAYGACREGDLNPHAL